MKYTVADLAAGGVFLRHLSCGDDQLAVNVADGEFPVKGHHDLYATRYDAATGRVVDYVPPQPSPDHAWSASSRRWEKRPEVVQREHQRAQALAQIDTLERKQLRAQRELLLDPSNADALKRLQAVDGEIATLRRVV
jgi:hypothetical protein